MRLTVAGLNLLLGSIYTSYGIMSIADLKRGWTTRGELHFALAWVAMAFTCGPHHLEHGLHTLLYGSAGGSLDAFAVIVGIPAGATWFLLRVEAFRGGRGDRTISGTPGWVRHMPWFWGAVFMVMVAGVARLQPQSSYRAVLVPNLWLFVLYMVIGFYLLRTQLNIRRLTGDWSVSGLSLSIVFPTCAAMHMLWLFYAAAGVYALDMHLLVIDWLGVPAALYFVWVVRALYRGEMSTTPPSAPAPAPATVGV